MKFDRRSLGVKIWLYFALFSAAILILIWLLQTVFLGSFYEVMKTRTIEATASEIAGLYGQPGFERSVDLLAYKNSILIYVTDDAGTLIYTSDEHRPGGGRFKPGGGQWNQPVPVPVNYPDFLQRLADSGKNAVSYTITTQEGFLGKTLIYGMNLTDAVLFISSPLEALDATTDILRTMLVYITVITLISGFVVAIFISRKLSRPIINITQTAERLAGGDYSVQFEKGHYSEIDALSSTLNYTARELSKVEALRRELIANISHDFRTPLTMIKGYTEMIEEVSGDDKKKREKHLAIIKEETARLEGLVDDVLELSLLQSGNEQIHPQNVNLSDAVKSVLRRFALLFENDGYIIKSDVEHDLYVFADKARTEQVLYNLIGNAVNYAGEDKTIFVTLKDSGGCVRFEVRDNGAGIAAEDLPYIWDRYYKSNAQPRTKISTGIGLSIVKNILQMHGARFGADSEIAKGSVFWFELKK